MSNTEEKRSGQGQGESRQVSRGHSQSTGGSRSQIESEGISTTRTTAFPEGETWGGDPERAPWRTRPRPPAASPLAERWLIPPPELAAAEQQVLKAELARLAADPETAVAVAAGASSEEVWLVLPVRTGQLTEGAQAILRGPAARGGRSADTPKRPPPRL